MSVAAGYLEMEQVYGGVFSLLSGLCTCQFWHKAVDTLRCLLSA